MLGKKVAFIWYLQHSLKWTAGYLLIIALWVVSQVSQAVVGLRVLSAGMINQNLMHD